ncbi:MAG: cation-translocating P-type ATPase, partial [Leptospiraceae bacterium]|nr:cation-translocating P-type ATPase [Leptospiraceae bacterium]
INLLLGNWLELYFESTASILSFVGLGKYLEKKAKHKTKDLFQILIDSLPKEVKVFRNDLWITLPIKEVRVGDKLKVLAGEKIPCDSKIIAGRSHIEESIFTGESLPVWKQEGDTLLAGSLCLDGILILEVLNLTSKLEKSFYLLQQALTTKPKIQLLVDKIASVFVPSVLFISFLTLCAWLLITGNVTKAFLSAISVLVISCPCALGLATPTALLVGNSLALKNGILFKNSETLENLEKLKVIFWDKTGTLTKGKPSVIHVSNSHLSKQEIEILIALVSSNFHPFSKAIQDFYNLQTNLTLENVQVLSGVGIKASFEKQEYALVSERYLLEKNIPYSFEISDSAASFFLKGNQILSVFYFADELKTEAKQTIQKLKEMQIESRILSGDRKEVTRKIANELEIKISLGELSPEEKKEEIEKLKQNGTKIGMVGEGVNDIHALVNADVSFSFHSGTEIAREASDVTILKEDLLLVPKSIQLGKKIINKIKQNLLYA